MADTVSAAYSFVCNAEETVDLSLDNTGDPTITHQIDSTSGTIDASSTVPATKAWSDQRTLTAGSDSLDLTSLARSPLAAVDMTGLKVQLIKIKAATANTAGIVFDVGSSNGYNLWGGATDQVTLLPGNVVMLFGDDELPDVAAGAKAIDITSGDADAIYDILIVAG